MSLPSTARTWAHFHSTVTKPSGSYVNTGALVEAYNIAILAEVVRLLTISSGSAGVWTHIASSATGTSSSTNQWTNGTTTFYTNLSMNTTIAGYTSQPLEGTGVGTPANAAGSWIVLKASNFFDSNVPLYMTLQLGKSNSFGACSIFLSREEPTYSGSTVTIRPQPASGKELTYRTGMLPQVGTPAMSAATFALGAFGTVPFAGNWSTQSSALVPASVRVHVMRSAKGFRFFVHRFGDDTPFMTAAVDYVDGFYADPDDYPPVAMFWESSWLAAGALPSNSAAIKVDDYWKQRKVRMYRTNAQPGGVPFDCYMTQESIGAGNAPSATTAAASLLSGVNELTETPEYPLLPIGLASTCTSAVGRHGYIADMYWGSEKLLPSALYPSSGSTTWVQVGGLVMPWDGTTFDGD